MQKEQFKVPYNETNLVGNIIPPGAKPELLIIHGAGQANSATYNYLREALAENNITSVAFDHVGHGETGGELLGSSLNDRVNQDIEIVNFWNLDQFSIIGGSMGGYEAIKLTEKFNIKTLILFVPGVFDREAYNLAFGPSFSVAIRKSESWKNSDAWEILSEYKGSLLIFYGEDDHIVPPELTAKIFESAKLADKKELIKFPNVGHQIHTYLREHPKDLEVVINKILEYIK